MHSKYKQHYYINRRKVKADVTNAITCRITNLKKLLCYSKHIIDFEVDIVRGFIITFFEEKDKKNLA